MSHDHGYSISLDDKYKEVRHNLSRSKRWFKNVKKPKQTSRDLIGCIFEHPSVPSLKFLIVVITVGLHYGVVCEDNTINLSEILDHLLWSSCDPTDKINIPWVSKTVCNMRNFDAKSLELLVTQHNENFTQFMAEVIANFNTVIEEFK